tara:strand:- start:3681 stop:4511 length:831 start_codon:yes stop_codon:yes gene_type:complete
MSKLRQFINEGRGSNELENSQSLNEKLSSSDLKDVKKSTGLSPDEQNDFIIIDAISDKVDAFKKSIEKLTSKIKTPEAESKSELVTDGLQEFIWQLGDYINASIDKVNSGLNESQSGQNLVDSLSKDIAHYTGLRVTAVIDFIGGDDKFAKKLFTFAKKGNLKDRLSITKAVLKGNKEFLNEGRFDYSNQQLLNFIESFADEQSSWGTQKLDADDVQFSAEIVTDGDKYLVDAIIKYDKGVKDKKGAAKWLADAVMSSGGNVSRQKDILARLRNSI